MFLIQCIHDPMPPCRKTTGSRVPKMCHVHRTFAARRVPALAGLLDRGDLLLQRSSL
jgi:hypothetical protein